MQNICNQSFIDLYFINIELFFALIFHILQYKFNQQKSRSN
jgi:hypothetical protein